MSLRAAAAAVLIIAFGLPSAAAAAAVATTAKTIPATTATTTKATATTTPQATIAEAPVPVPASATPPVGRRLSADRVLAIAQALPKMQAVRHKYPGSYDGAYLKGPLHWQVSFFSKNGAKEIGQVIIADATGRVLEQWTGFQVAWTMARGYPGAFGRHVNALYVWLPLCLLFFVPFFDWRKPLRLLHLDLLVLLSFSVSLAFFNHADIYASVPLTYPPLLYLLGRMLWLLRRRRPRMPPGVPSGVDAPPGAPAPAPASAPVPRLRLLVPAPWLAVGVVFLVGFRIGLNVTDSNVIDVGYAGVIGAEKIVKDKPLYGDWPQDNEHGDTYGPVTYEAYVPFEQVFGWSGTWDDLPAAHAAAIVFDLLALVLIFLLGLRIRGPTLGVALAYAWVSYPFTLFALESNSNDTLVAVLILAALLCATSAPARGVFAALAGLAKLAPLALAPLLATHGLWSREPAADDPAYAPAAPVDGPPAPGSAASPALGLAPAETLPQRRRRARTRARAYTAFWLAFIATAALVSIPALTHDSLAKIYARTLEYQANRGSPFSLWGLYGGSGLHGVETGVQLAAVALALALAVLPRRADVIGLAAACAAVTIATQLGVEHWFYLYIPWFFPLVMVALLGGLEVPRAGARYASPTSSAGVPSAAAQAAWASGSARSSPLGVVPSS